MFLKSSITYLIDCVVSIVPDKVKNLVGADKVGHFVAGFLISSVSVLICYLAGAPALATIASMLLPAVVGAAKELSDWLSNRAAARVGQLPPHGVEFLDFAATVLGGVPIWILLHLI